MCTGGCAAPDWYEVGNSTEAKANRAAMHCYQVLAMRVFSLVALCFCRVDSNGALANYAQLILAFDVTDMTSWVSHETHHDFIPLSQYDLTSSTREAFSNVHLAADDIEKDSHAGKDNVVIEAPGAVSTDNIRGRRLARRAAFSGSYRTTSGDNGDGSDRVCDGSHHPMCDDTDETFDSGFDLQDGKKINPAPESKKRRRSPPGIVKGVANTKTAANPAKPPSPLYRLYMAMPGETKQKIAFHNFTFDTKIRFREEAYDEWKGNLTKGGKPHIRYDEFKKWTTI